MCLLQCVCSFFSNFYFAGSVLYPLLNQIFDPLSTNQQCIGSVACNANMLVKLPELFRMVLDNVTNSLITYFYSFGKRLLEEVRILFCGLRKYNNCLKMFSFFGEV